MSSKKKTARLMINLDEDLFNKVQELAAKEGLSLSSFARRLLLKEVNK